MSPTAADLGRPLEILLAEDSPTEAILTKAALDKEIDCTLHHVLDGEEAMEFLRREGKHSEAPTPDLLLLDLNMPRMDGFQTLAAIRADAATKKLPVIILTTSDHDDDVESAYRLCANCFITKPADMSQFYEVVSSFKNFWLKFVQLPNCL